MQLDLFSGDHVPLLRCHAALDRGDLRDARTALADAAARAKEAALAEWLWTLEARLPSAGRPSADEAADPDDAAEAVHAAFEAALTGPGPMRVGQTDGASPGRIGILGCVFRQATPKVR